MKRSRLREIIISTEHKKFINETGIIPLLPQHVPFYIRFHVCFYSCFIRSFYHVFHLAFAFSNSSSLILKANTPLDILTLIYDRIKQHRPQPKSLLILNIAS